MILIQCDREEDELQYAATLERAAQAVLTDAAVTGDASIVLTDDKQLQALNLQYLEIDAPTDVLSFSSGEMDPDTEVVYLGDVIISLDRAAAQAAAGGHSVQDELSLLVVHGMLHLLGHDHGEAQEKEAMWASQARILGELGCKISGPAL